MCECYHVSGVRFQVVKVQSNRHTRGSLSYRFPVLQYYLGTRFLGFTQKRVYRAYSSGGLT